MEILLEHLGRGLMLSLLMSLPAVLMAAAIGLVVGILQAVTQVQEQTIAAAPKIVGVFAVILLGGGLMMNMMTDYVRESMQIAFSDVPEDGIFVMPTTRHQTPGQLRAKHFFELQAKEGANSAKLKEFAAQWEMPDSDGAAGATLKVRQGGSKGGALSIPEKMTLQKDGKR
ncbi:flagellar biosynthetic protein FliQ [Vampirovibrio chlorellavorus]|uniref:flagellar biosynthetic protein FliQ n=1 Tax=Vampirovibrio chlorellavorus TaxID=758823 RepID=UPI0026F020FD|nr:flagellar biosynthetic protein FliQ [Vampirovibrio chlorellavorus]